MSASPTRPPVQPPPLASAAALAQLTVAKIEVTQPAETLDYLARHTDFAPLLFAIAHGTRQQLGVNTELTLDVYRDPEARDEYLILRARQWPYEPAFRERLRAILAPFEERLADCSGWLLLTTDFAMPGGKHAGV